MKRTNWRNERYGNHK